MLELDAWLSSLDDALLAGDERVISAMNALLSCEAPELLAMMHGDAPVPNILKIYLQKL
ncbi:MAG: succinate dehydrogenase assembly factor 2 [Proteobacteria bacterium]|nr:MAG: succinate dehydrogenase assembly factor 2 [Pseudomonadota bacterium]